MVPFCIICAILLIFFLLIINKTLEGMSDLNIQAKDVAKILKVTTNVDIDNTADKIDQIKGNTDFVDPSIIEILNNPDTTNQEKLDILNDKIKILDDNYRRPESIVSLYNETTPSKPLNSTEFKQILTLIFDDDITDELKVERIKAMNIRYNEVLSIIDNQTLSARVKLLGMEEDGEIPVTQDTVLNALLNPPIIPVKKEKGGGGGGGKSKASKAIKNVFKKKKK